MSRYLIIIESTATGFSGYSPDLPGCAATGRTRAEVEQEMHDTELGRLVGGALAIDMSLLRWQQSRRAETLRPF